MDGMINVYKEQGFTSHDVVAKLRGIVKQKKIGHTGTLDPAAEGVLPVCLGKATKVCDLLTDKDKTYRAVLLLGRTTDTQDTTGVTISEKTPKVSREDVVKVIQSFVGEYDQIPPMYSALKVGGKKLYELARQGKEVERAARKVRILEIVIENIELPRVTMTVSCSKGTYIRTLCHDIGNVLGCGGCMESLVRTRVADFSAEEALTLSEIEKIRDEGRLSEILLPVDGLFKHYPAKKAKKGVEKLLYNGNPLLPEEMEEMDGETQAVSDRKQEVSDPSSTKIRLYDPMGDFMGIYKFDPEIGRFRPEKIFYDTGNRKG